MRQADFLMLDPDIQSNYEMYVAQYEQLEADKQRQLLAAQADFIPTDGALVKADYYVSMPDGKTQRAVFPARALEWLVQRLADQGRSQEQLLALPTQAQAEIMGQTVQSGPVGLDMSGNKDVTAMMNQQATSLQGGRGSFVPPGQG
jgi:hypothetical protein